ncbi:MAG: metal-dependent hydrolase [Acidobacteriia bacterium]|nr:metal-dependent hydrolase [Terriglobia bacterium]
MFIGHFGVAMAAKRAAPRTSLGTLFLAAQWADLLAPILWFAGIEQVRIAPGTTRVTPLDFVSYPISHSLLMDAVWATLLAGVYWAVRRYLRGAVMVWLAVLSHWVLDFLTHRPDMPLLPGGGPRVGLGLWNSLPGTIVVEGLIFVAGIALYLRATKARDGIGRYGFWALIAVLALVYLANLFGPPPPSVRAIAWAGQSMWALVAWAYWIDHHRTALHTEATHNK